MSRKKGVGWGGWRGQQIVSPFGRSIYISRGGDTPRHLPLLDLSRIDLNIGKVNALGT